MFLFKGHRKVKIKININGDIFDQELDLGEEVHHFFNYIKQFWSE